ncbi:SDR family oxidoreductase [Microbacterium saccharophilum]|uniref:SDR family oxidoreductase n=1 Tax=Microbacterium saccharophilum TaxID=1213358 RepID=A0A5C8HZW3_9MICO|nr:SDR family oxidoreductase [Microbacterium saccharophilum]TXK11268.1 SDR family oxidoreductase [Microbacterium saccharophilum]GEP48619.1 nucleoside-diphosphate sugar epimerase [Microbacterium saccharophilum]
MRIAVAGATGTVGRHIVAAVEAQGDEVIPVTRSAGIDLLTRAGLERALDGVDAVVDAVNVSTLSAEKAAEFFATATGNLGSAARAAGAANVVLLSIVGIDRNPHGYYAGKVAQERALIESGAPATIVRATQFHEFAAQIAGRARIGPLPLAPTGRVQPIAAAEVGIHLARTAAQPPHGLAPDLAGPREEALDDMVRRWWSHAHGRRGWIPSIALPGAQMKGMRAGLNLPGPDAVLGTQTFDEWLSAQ